MGILSKLLGFNALSLEDPSQPLLPYGALHESLGLGRSDAGVMVNQKQAMRNPSVFTCIKVISEDLGSLSLDIYQQMPDGSLTKAVNHKNYSLLHDRPNPYMSSQTWRMTMLSNVCGWGNGYSWIVRDNAARVVKLVPLAPDKTNPVMIEGKLLYATTQTPSGEVTYIDSEDILHFHCGPLENGIIGLSPIQQCQNTIGLAIASEKFTAQFYGNGARATGVFTHPQHLDPESYEIMKKSYHEALSGNNSLRPLILEEGMTYTQLTINPQDAQMLETMKWTKEQIASIYRVPLFLLQDLARATNSNLEFQGTSYVRHCLMAYATQMEAEIKYKILGLKTPFIVEHNFQDLTRGDTATLTTSLISLRNAGVYSGNDVLRALRQNPIPTEEGGDIRIVQGAFIPLDSLLLEDDKPATPETDTTNTDEGNPAGHHKPQFLAAYRPLFRDAVGRVINRSNDQSFIKKAFQPTVASLLQALLASRFGQAELTEADLTLVATVVNDIAMNAQTWKKEDAASIAKNVTEEVFNQLTRGITHEQIT